MTVFIIEEERDGQWIPVTEINSDDVLCSLDPEDAKEGAEQWESTMGIPTRVSKYERTE